MVTRVPAGISRYFMFIFFYEISLSMDQNEPIAQMIKFQKLIHLLGLCAHKVANILMLMMFYKFFFYYYFQL